MSRRAKLLITALFLVLLTIPAAHVALTWHVADPFRFRYMGQGEAVARTVDTFRGGPEVAWVPISIEVQNTASRPIHLGTVKIMAEHGIDPGHDLELLWAGPPIPRQGSVRLEVLVERTVAQRLSREAFKVSYGAVSTTKRKALDVLDWMREIAAPLLSLDAQPADTTADRFVTPLIIAPAHLQEPSPSKTTSSP